MGAIGMLASPLRRPHSEDVQAAGHGGTEEPGCLRCQRAQFHQMFQAARLHHELADIDGPVTPCHVGNHDVQAGTVGKCGIDKRGRHVQAAPELLSMRSTRSRTCWSVRETEVSSDSPFRAT